ncbi:MAG: hypothetical protein ABI364_09110 [Caldimonas sp.]
MKTLAKLTLSLVVLASGAASAATMYSHEADQARRDRNRDEAIAAYEASPQYRRSQNEHMNDGTMKQKSHRAANTVRRDTHRAASKVRKDTHKSAQAVRGFTHRQAEKVRDFTDRENAKYGESGKNMAGENAKK